MGRSPGRLPLVPLPTYYPLGRQKNKVSFQRALRGHLWGGAIYEYNIKAVQAQEAAFQVSLIDGRFCTPRA
jgi:hypothetical protein